MKTLLLIMTLGLLAGCGEKKPSAVEMQAQAEEQARRDAVLLNNLRKAASSAQFSNEKSHSKNATPGDAVDYERDLKDLDEARIAAKGLAGVTEAESKGRAQGSDFYKLTK